jgi:hypothetical protein
MYDTFAETDLQVSPFAFFLESGITVDGSAVSHLNKPDAVPLGNWTDGGLGNILEFKFAPKISEVSRMTPTASGVWEDQPIRRVMSHAIVLKTRMMGEYVRRLEHAVAAKIVRGVAQAHGTVSDPAIYGWLRAQLIRESTGTLEVFDWWSKMTLDSANTFNEQTPTPSLRFTRISTVAGVAVTGNTVVWPEAAA